MIEPYTSWNQIVNALGGVAMLAFGLWVLTVRPRTRLTKLLAVFAIAVGAVYIPENLLQVSGWEEDAIFRPYLGAGWALAGAAILGLAHSIIDAPDEGGPRLRYAAPAITGLLVLAPLASLIDVLLTSEGPLETWQIGTITFQVVALWFWTATLLAFALVLAWRYHHPPQGREEATRTQAVLLSTALVLWPSFMAGRNAVRLADPTGASPIFSSFGASLFVGCLTLTGLWLANTRAVPDRSAEGRNLALLILAMLLAGTIELVFVDPLVPEESGPLGGLIRLAMVLILGYAILRHQVLGIEAKFRWGLSKTTVAGVFIAVFFIVSEGAQELFAGFAGSEFLGILAAGALLFALAPIQRMADRVAERAVPGGGTTDGSPAEETYRASVEMALADGEITREEERQLAEKAEELGLTPTEAQTLREQVEDETTGGDAG